MWGIYCFSPALNSLPPLPVDSCVFITINFNPPYQQCVAHFPILSIVDTKVDSENGLAWLILNAYPTSLRIGGVLTPYFCEVHYCFTTRPIHYIYPEILFFGDLMVVYSTLVSMYCSVECVRTVGFGSANLCVLVFTLEDSISVTQNLNSINKKKIIQPISC